MTPVDQEIVLHAQRGTLSEEPEAIAVKEEKRYQSSDVVTIIVALEGEPSWIIWTNSKETVFKTPIEGRR